MYTYSWYMDGMVVISANKQWAFPRDRQMLITDEYNPTTYNGVIYYWLKNM